MASLDIWTVLAALVCTFICGRVVTFKRGDKQYRFWVSFCAWLIAASSGCYAMSVTVTALKGMHVAPVSPWLLLMISVFAVLVFKSKGNIAAIVRLDWSDRWDGRNRRHAHK